MKITLAEWKEIGQYLPVRKPFEKVCTFKLEVAPDGDIRRECWISLPAYLALFVPVTLMSLVWCAWDGGLKEFEISPRRVCLDWLPVGSIGYAKAKKIMEKRKGG